MSENRYGSYADCIRTLLVEPTTTDSLSNLVISSDLTVDTNTLYVNSVNNRVGIVKINPQYPLDVTGDINTTTGLKIAGNSVLSGSTLGSTILNSSLTSLGTMTSDLNMGTKNISNVGNLAGTLTTAAQPNITSLGSLTSFTLNAKANLNDSLYLGAYLANNEGKGIFFRASSGAAFQEGGSGLFNLSITTWDQSTSNVSPDGMSFNAYDGFRWVTGSGATAATIPMQITQSGATTISTLAVTNAITNKQTPKAFICFDGTALTTKNSFNISNMTRNATGIYTITFSTAMANTNYVWFGTAGYDNFAQSVWVSSPSAIPVNTWKTTTTLKFQVYYANNSTNTNPDDINIIIFN